MLEPRSSLFHDNGDLSYIGDGEAAHRTVVNHNGTNAYLPSPRTHPVLSADVALDLFHIVMGHNQYRCYIRYFGCWYTYMQVDNRRYSLNKGDS